jgi:very-short-patch-repair endonuclease
MYNIKVKDNLYNLNDVQKNILALKNIEIEDDKFINETEVVNLLKNHKNFNIEQLVYFYDNNISINIINFENKPIHSIKKNNTVYLKLRDIIRILNYTECNKLNTLIEYNKNFKNVVRITDLLDIKYGKILGREISLFFITLEGLEQILLKSKKNITIRKKLVKFFNLDIKIGKESIINKETRYDDIIKKCFPSVKIINQYSIKNYLIDWYFPEYNLALECDEFNHKKYLSISKTYDIDRENEIKKALKCEFIRFNPDSEDFCVFDLIGKIFNFFKGVKVNKNENSNKMNIEIKSKKLYDFNFDNLDKDFISLHIENLNFNKVNFCIDCYKEILSTCTRCRICSDKKRIIEIYKNKPSYETLIKEIKETNYIQVGKKYNVSDRAIRKWIKTYEKHFNKSNN